MSPVEEIPKYAYTGNTIRYTVQNIIDWLAVYFKIDSQAITDPGNEYGNLPRKIALYLASKLTGESQKKIAIAFKLGTYTAVSKNYHRLAWELKTNNAVAKTIAEIINQTSLDTDKN
ncbi:MAG TPA: hypothetical protein VNK03_03915 [Gammaproteobacteria bacterium]|nr:hypothetical protein [Gammaproteobacteria bacterium]